jgi:CheY-like chemotaxis protein
MSKVIMIDDNPMEHMIIQKMFIHFNLFQSAEHVSDGRKVLEHLKNNLQNPTELPDLIFLDLHMPNFNGFDFLTEFHDLYLSFRKNISIYIISSSIDEDDRLRASAYLFVKDFLVKPVKKEKLIEIYAEHHILTSQAG